MDVKPGRVQGPGPGSEVASGHPPGHGNRRCRARQDHSWIWLVAAVLVLVGAVALLIALVVWFPRVRL
jgi:hypothetical protein